MRKKESFVQHFVAAFEVQGARVEVLSGSFVINVSKVGLSMGWCMWICQYAAACGSVNGLLHVGLSIR